MRGEVEAEPRMTFHHQALGIAGRIGNDAKPLAGATQRQHALYRAALDQVMDIAVSTIVATITP